MKRFKRGHEGGGEKKKPRQGKKGIERTRTHTAQPGGGCTY